ncbi:hypothetical protein PENTCL1PPCAC_7642 [Pristionchus entomophagus]|uniref:G protein-coupled receptor n=1 Tax=Pristionchus entomophagus TaxID=358040 RepID=A0AAV5SQ19_9BILA|nr:hypothetical protein PENTCL1PPCAC_7642 [Pristionchus entomophagus]
MMNWTLGQYGVTEMNSPSAPTGLKALIYLSEIVSLSSRSTAFSAEMRECTQYLLEPSSDKPSRRDPPFDPSSISRSSSRFWTHDYRTVWQMKLSICFTAGSGPHCCP